MKTTKIALIGLSLVGLGVGVCLFLSRAKPVVWAVHEKGEPSGHPIFLLLNPFRDRSAERVCESALKALRDRNGQAVGAALCGIDGNARIIDHELKNDVKKWNIADLKINGDTTIIYFDVTRVEGGEATPTHIFLRRRANGWQIVDWESWY